MFESVLFLFTQILWQKFQEQSIVGRNLGNAGLNGLHFIGRASVFLGSKQSYFLPLLLHAWEWFRFLRFLAPFCFFLAVEPTYGVHFFFTPILSLYWPLRLLGAWRISASLLANQRSEAATLCGNLVPSLCVH